METHLLVENNKIELMGSCKSNRLLNCLHRLHYLVYIVLIESLRENSRHLEISNDISKSEFLHDK